MSFILIILLSISLSHSFNFLFSRLLNWPTNIRTTTTTTTTITTTTTNDNNGNTWNQYSAISIYKMFESAAHCHSLRHSPKKPQRASL